MSIFDKKRLQKLKEIELKDKKHTIMIVDDEEAHLSSMESLLSEDYHIITAKDGQEALDMIIGTENPGSISLIISDQRMPKLTGLQLFEKIKDILPNTIRIILTAYDDKDVMMDAINKIEIDKFILKPFEPEDLKNSIKRAVESFEIQLKAESRLQTLEKKYQRLLQKVKKLEENIKQIRKKLKVLNRLDSIIYNSQTLEAEIHNIFEKNLWIFGDEYSDMASDETIETSVWKFLGKRYKGDHAKSRPDLLLAGDKENTYLLLIEFKKPAHKLDRANECQTLVYRDELSTHFPNSRIEIILIGGGIKRNIPLQYLRKDVKYLSYQNVISRARKRLKNLIE